MHGTHERVSFQRVKDRQAFEPIGSWENDAPQTTVIFIGERLEKDELARAFEGCLVCDED